MKLSLKKTIGTILFSIGLVLLISSQSLTLTGNIVADRIVSLGTISGVLMFIGGVLLMIKK